jgi:hypothetical protein
MRIRRLFIATGATLACLLAGLTVAGPATATNRHHHHPSASGLHGVTRVDTAQGIAGTLLRAGILPLPVRPTCFGVHLRDGLVVSYGFPITGGNPDLSGPSGHILHSGGINFVSARAHLEIGKFDISLADGKIYATEVNHAAARIPVLDLDLSALSVTARHGATVLSDIGLRLDPAAAQALNATFGIALPTDGSLVFGHAQVTLRS